MHEPAIYKMEKTFLDWNYLNLPFYIQAFLNFGGFDFWDFRFNAVYNSILFSSPLVLLSNLNLRSFCFLRCPYNNSVNQGMPVIWLCPQPDKVSYLKWKHVSHSKFCFPEFITVAPQLLYSMNSAKLLAIKNYLDGSLDSRHISS